MDVNPYQAMLNQLEPGPWKWGGTRGDAMLKTAGRGGIVLMAMDNAHAMGDGSQLLFQDHAEHVLHDGVSRWYRYVNERQTLVADIDHPLAQLIKAIPEMVARINELEEQLAIALASGGGH